MDVANIEDMVANDLFIHAKNGVENRKKYVKKVRFPGNKSLTAEYKVSSCTRKRLMNQSQEI